MAQLDLIGNILYQKRIQNILPLIKGKLLGVGCGTNELVKKYGNGIGIDVFQFGGADLIVADSSKTPFINNEFDTVTFIASLNQIPNRLEVLKEMRRLLKKDGMLIITMISPGISRAWHYLRKPWDKDQIIRGMKKGEVYGLSTKQVGILLKQAGFKVNKINRFMLGLNKIYIANKN